MNIGGPALHVSLLSAGLNQKGYEHLLVAGSESEREGNLADLATKEGVKIRPLPALGREISPPRDIFCLLQLRRILRDYQPDIVHTHTAKAGFIGRMAGLLERVPVLAHTFHGHVLTGYFSLFQEALFRRLEAWLAARTQLLITVSEAVADDLARLGVASRSRFTIVPLGLALRPFLGVRPHPELKKQLGLRDGSVLVGAVGRLVPVKNLRLLIQAVGLLAPQYPLLNLALIGDGGEREALIASARTLGIEKKVHFLGWRRDLPWIYGGLDVVALTSVNEGTPVSLIEAIASGRPVVATGVGGVPEVLEHGKLGILVPSGDAKALAQGLNHAWQNKQGPVEADRSRVVEKFAPERLVRDMDSHYREPLALRLPTRLS